MFATLSLPRTCGVLTLAALALALPGGGQAAVFGVINAAGQAAAPTVLADGSYEAGGTAFDVAGGHIVPRADLAGAAPGAYTLGDGTRTDRVEIREHHLCISGREELIAALGLPPERLAGLTVCLNPGLYEMSRQDFVGRQQGLPADRPLTVTSADPDDRARLTQWSFASLPEGPPTGNVVLRGLDFEISDPEVALGTSGFFGTLRAIELGLGAVTENVLVEDVRITGNLREARAGGLETERNLVGVGGNGRNITVRGSVFSRITDAFSLSGEDLTYEYNRFFHNWGDFVQLYGQGNKQSCRPTRGVTIRNNIVSDAWSSNRIHPDFVHLFPSYGMECGVEDVLIEGNIAYLGEAALQPAWPTLASPAPPVPAPEKIPFEDRRMWRLIGPGTSELPPASCPEGPVLMGVQRDPEGGPVTLRPAPGQELRVGPKQRVAEFDLIAEWETWELLCPGRGANRWELRHAYPAVQGVFSNAVHGTGGYVDFTVRNNVFWLNAVHGVDLRDTENRNISITNNSLLQPFPGDTDGDGRANTTADGFNVPFSGLRIEISGASGIDIARNISSAMLPGEYPPPVRRMNDHGLRHDDKGLSMERRFTPTGPGPVFFPQSPAEAIAAARPRPDGILAGRNVGALASDPAADWYDWSWVPDPDATRHAQITP